MHKFCRVQKSRALYLEEIALRHSYLLVFVVFTLICAGLPALSETALPNGGWEPAWSSDGSAIAFTSGSPHSIPNLWVIKSDKTGLRQITTNGAHNPVWMRDGKTIVFGTVRNGKSTFASIATDGLPGSEKPLDMLPAGAEAPVWSPDGTLIAYAIVSADGKSRDLLFARSSGGASTGLTAKFWCREWTWSPDGSTITFVVGKSTGTSIWTLNVGTKNMKLLYKGFCSSPVYSPDGKLLAIAVPDVQSGFKIGIINLATGLDKRIGVETYNGQKLIWSNDGKRLFYESNRKSEPAIWSVGIDRTNITRITPAGVPSMSMALSPDGTKIACQIFAKSAYCLELALCSTTGESLTKLTNSSKQSYWSPVWSPDGKQLAYQTDVNHKQDLFLGSPDGGVGKPCTEIYGEIPAEVSWLSGGKKLLVADSGRLLIVNPAGGKNAAKPFPKLTAAVQSPRLNGDEIIVTEWGARDAFISALKLDGSARRVITQIPEPEPKKDDSSKPDEKKTPDADKPVNDGASVPSNMGTGPLLVAQAETGNPHSGLGQMGPIENVAVESKPAVIDFLPAISPNHKTIAFTRNNQIWLVNIDGADAKQVTKFAFAEGEKLSILGLCWSAKGDSILFTAISIKPGKVYLELWMCGTEAGSERLVYSEKAESEYGMYYSECTNPAVFMGETRILFTSISNGEPRIVSVDLNGGDLRELVPAPSIFPALDNAGKRLAYVDLSNSLERIRVLDIATGKQSKILFSK